MAFTVASWNVEFFGSRKPGGTAEQAADRVDRVFEYLRNEIDADVYAIYEVNGGQVFDKVTEEFADYTWQITEGTGSQAILFGHRHDRVQAFVTHRSEFSRGWAGPLRPGVLAAVTEGGQTYPMLFLHLKSADAPIDFSVRAYQHEKARNLRKALDRADASDRAPYIIAGDLNNLGMNLTFSDRDIEISDELARLREMYESRYDKMSIRPKNHDETFWNGPGSSDDPVDIDHVIASDRVRLAQHAGGHQIEVMGWPEKNTAQEKGQWISEYSDHALLKFTVDGVN